MANRRSAKFKLGATDVSLAQAGNPEALLWAGELLFDGLEVSIGRKPVEGKLALASPTLQKKYLDEAKKQNCPIGSLCLDILHDDGLKVAGDARAPRWIADAIPIAKALGVKVIRLPCRGAQALAEADIDHVGDLLKQVAPAAAKAHVILGLDTTLSARDNARILDRSKSKAVQIAYDVNNAHKNKFDAAAEIRWLGAGRLCEVLLQDNPHFLGEGAIDFHPVVDALSDVGFDRFVQLETSAPSGDFEMDMIKNVNFVRALIRERNGK